MWVLVVDGLEKALLNSTTAVTHIRWCRCSQEMTGTLCWGLLPQKPPAHSVMVELNPMWNSGAALKQSMLLPSVCPAARSGPAVLDSADLPLLSFVLSISFTSQQQGSCLVSCLHLSHSLRVSVASWVNSVSRNALFLVGLARRLHLILRTAHLDTMMDEFVSWSFIAATPYALK